MGSICSQRSQIILDTGQSLLNKSALVGFDIQNDEQKRYDAESNLKT